ncbi:MAG: hypothetical protein DI537_37745 [Stutzerimonas stutzeri]|nr:MAG: hypothetical protein DI537_37745 [Stutzerimonas stutzeri]
MLVEITKLVPGMIVVLAWLFRRRLIAVPVLVEISGLVAWMVMILAGFFLCHVSTPFRGTRTTVGMGPLFPCEESLRRD